MKSGKFWYTWNTRKSKNNMKFGNTGKSKNIQKSGKSWNTERSENTLKSGNSMKSGNTWKTWNAFEISHLVDFWSCFFDNWQRLTLKSLFNIAKPQLKIAKPHSPKKTLGVHLIVISVSSESKKETRGSYGPPRGRKT